jgi:hypothetical protein
MAAMHDTDVGADCNNNNTRGWEYARDLMLTNHPMPFSLTVDRPIWEQIISSPRGITSDSMAASFLSSCPPGSFVARRSNTTPDVVVLTSISSAMTLKTMLCRSVRDVEHFRFGIQGSVSPTLMLVEDCFVCMTDQYTDTNPPKVLACKHMGCHDCVSRIQADAMGNTPKCPLCRADMVVQHHDHSAPRPFTEVAVRVTSQFTSGPDAQSCHLRALEPTWVSLQFIQQIQACTTSALCIGAVLDASPSMEGSMFSQLKESVVQMIQVLVHMSETQGREVTLAIVPFADCVGQVWVGPLNRDTKPGLAQYVQDLRTFGRGTDLGCGLHHLFDIMPRPTMVFQLTDGRQTTGDIRDGTASMMDALERLDGFPLCCCPVVLGAFGEGADFKVFSCVSTAVRGQFAYIAANPSAAQTTSEVRALTPTAFFAENLQMLNNIRATGVKVALTAKHGWRFSHLHGVYDHRILEIGTFIDGSILPAVQMIPPKEGHDHAGGAPPTIMSASFVTNEGHFGRAELTLAEAPADEDVHTRDPVVSQALAATMAERATLLAKANVTAVQARDNSIAMQRLVADARRQGADRVLTDGLERAATNYTQFADTQEEEESHHSHHSQENVGRQASIMSACLHTLGHARTGTQ